MYNLLEQLPNNIPRICETYKRNGIILNPDDDCHSLYILTQGEAAVYLHGPEGDLLHVYHYRAVDFFGETELLSDRSKPLQISALTDCTILRVGRQDFYTWLEQDFAFCRYIMGRLSQKLYEGADRTARFSALNLRQRYLLAIHQHHLAGDLGTLRKARLAEEIHAPIRSLNRVIAQATDLIQYREKRFHILQPETLAALCQEYALF